MTVLAHSQFKKIAQIAQENWGLNFTDQKETLVANRLAKFLRKSPFDDAEDYLKHLQKNASQEDMLEFFDLLSTNVTSFFREHQHFDYLEREFYTALNRNNRTTPGRRIRIWSAACSTGPEPYSLAMHAIEHLTDLDSWDVRVLATDLSTSVLDTAKTAIYPEQMIEELPRDIVKKYFLKGTGDKADMVQVASHVREMVSIGRVNLMEDWPFQGPFEVIFCRNVMIYFDKPTRQRLVNRLYDMLSPGGILAIGSAESLSGLNTKFRSVQPSVYVK